jgi:hypothetical protein
MNMKRPETIVGQIRYFGLALSEMAAECYEKGIAFYWEINGKHEKPIVQVRFGKHEWEKVYNVQLGCNRVILNSFEANIEAEMEACND